MNGRVFAKSSTEVQQLIDNHEVENCVKFVKVDGNFKQMTSADPIQDVSHLQKHQARLYFIDGALGIKNGSAFLVCQHGPDSNGKKKRSYKQEQELSQSASLKKQRTCIQDSYKFGCPAKVTIHRQVIFCINDMTIPYDEDSKDYKRCLLQTVRIRIARKDPTLKFTERYIVTFPDAAHHKNHPVGKDNLGYLPMDDRLKRKVKSLVTDLCITSTKRVKEHLQDFVLSSSFSPQKPERTNQRFFPHPKTLKNFIDKVLAENLSKPRDQDDLEGIMQRLPPSHSWKFRKGQGEDSSLLLVHQTDNQKRLLSQYGNNLCTLDAVYKTTKYSLPTFFIVIRADTTHQVVGSFIVSEETHNAIEEAVRVIREWNPSWNPLYWMTDCCAAVIDALENVFPEAYVYVCDFHRTQEWERWLASSTNGVQKKDMHTLKQNLRAIAQSQSEEDLIHSRGVLERSREWRIYPKFQKYMRETWFSDDVPKRWVRCYRSHGLLRSIRPDNSIEAINTSVKNSMKGCRRPTLSMLCTKLLRWLSDHYDRYMYGNQKSMGSSRQHITDIPQCLRQQPHDFVDHVMSRLGPARELLQYPDCYEVQVGSGPTCECEDFHRHSYPCKHILKHWLDSQGCLNIPDTDLDRWVSVDVSSSDSLGTDNVPVGDCAVEEVTTHRMKRPARKLRGNLPSQLQKVRDVLDELKDWTYRTSSSSAANRVYNQLLAIRDEAVRDEESFTAAQSIQYQRGNLRH